MRAACIAGCVLAFGCGHDAEPAAPATAPPAPVPAPAAPAPPAAPVEPQAPPDLTDPHSFWTAFRAAVLADDVAAVAAMTSFPLTTRGSMDSCPEVQHDRAAFDALWPQLLAVDPGLGHGENQRALVERLEAIPESERRHLARGDGLRMGDFEFEKDDAGEYRLHHAYWAADGC